MNKKLVASLLTAILLVQTTAYAAATTAPETSDTAHVITEEKQSAGTNQADSRPVLTLQEAIEKGMKSSVLLEEVQNKADIAKLVKDNSLKVRDDLTSAESDLGAAYYMINDGRDKIYAASNELSAAQNAVSKDWCPQAIYLGDIKGKVAAQLQGKVPTQVLQGIAQLPDNTMIASQGETFASVANKVNEMVGLPIMSATTIKAMLTTELTEKSDQLEASKRTLAASTKEYLSKNGEYEAALKYALNSVTSKLSTSTISSLEAAPLGDLIVKMCTKQDEITSYSISIYKNQIALLAANSYYEALKQQELLAVKEKAVERGKKQYELAEAAYEVGAKAKDEMFIAKSYYDSTIMYAEQQRKEYQTAMLTLKKNLNIDFDKDFILQSTEPDFSQTYDVKAGVKNGLQTRLEMKMAAAQKDLCGYLSTAVEESNYSDTSNQREEVKLLQKQADLNYKNQSLEVEAGIRSSYETMESTRKLAETAKDLRENAEQTVEIAKAKYEVGYGYSNSLLSSLHIEQMSGTMVEVIAAEENLANIQEKEVEAKDGYNLARLKYLNDIGVLPY